MPDLHRDEGGDRIYACRECGRKVQREELPMCPTVCTDGRWGLRCPACNAPHALVVDTGSRATACVCGACPIDADYWPEARTEAARQCAWGVENGTWACDCIEWDAADAAEAYAYLYGQEVSRRDQLREGIHTLEREGLIDTARGDAILSSAGLPACSIHRASLEARHAR